MKISIHIFIRIYTKFPPFQVYRLPEMGNATADLVLGVKMVPGNDKRHFCKPTDVAVMADGTFFVADGYCNYRVIRFKPDGTFEKQWGESPAGSGLRPPPLAFAIPHGLALNEEKGEASLVSEPKRILRWENTISLFLRSVDRQTFGFSSFSYCCFQSLCLFHCLRFFL